MMIQVIGENAKPLKELVQQTHETAENCLRTNYYGIKQLSKSLIPLLLLSNSARIVNVSSIAGQLEVQIQKLILLNQVHAAALVMIIFGQFRVQVLLQEP